MHRCAWDARNRRTRLGWYAAAAVACLFGGLSKEIIISAPIAVVLYDRVFRLPSWRAVWRAGETRQLARDLVDLLGDRGFSEFGLLLEPRRR